MASGLSQQTINQTRIHLFRIGNENACPSVGYQTFSLLPVSS